VALNVFERGENLVQNGILLCIGEVRNLV